MSFVDARVEPPHFHSVGLSQPSLPRVERAHDPSVPDPVAVGRLMIRGADCLIAALQECVGEAGLNEARYRVLAALRQCASGECSQAELAEALLQSESNLSTLLERMNSDGLILRRRSEADRRRSLIRIAPAGAQALARAERVRATVIARLMRQIPREEAVPLVQSLERLVGGLERSLEVTPIP